MEQVKLRQVARAQVEIQRFGGYDHREGVREASDRYGRQTLSWYDTRNLSSDGYPLLTVRRRRVPVDELDGLDPDGIVALCDREHPVALYDNGTIGCAGKYLQLLPPDPRASAEVCDITIFETAIEDSTVGVVTIDDDRFGESFVEAGEYMFQYDREEEYWNVSWRRSSGEPWQLHPFNPIRNSALASYGITEIEYQPDDQDDIIVSLAMDHDSLGSVSVNAATFSAAMLTKGYYKFVYDAHGVWDVYYRQTEADAWATTDHTQLDDDDLSALGITTDFSHDPVGDQGWESWFTVRLYEQADLSRRRQLVNMGAFVCVWPDKIFVNAEKLATVASTALMINGTDYGSLEQENTLVGDEETLTLTLCDADGNAYTGVTVDDTAPADGYWIDTSEDVRVLKQYSASMSAWINVASVYVKVEGDSVGEGMKAGDGVTLDCVLPQTVPEGEEEAWAELGALLNGSRVLHAAANNHIVVNGIFSPPGGQSLTITMARGSGTEQPHLVVSRRVPDMDFVVECGNRLWGCYYGVKGTQILNEIYASKLGDMKNWNAFEGLSTDSYAASRGSDGPFTGAAVLDGHPLFFKERVLEKVFPSASGAHQIQTQTLDGVQAGSDRSLCIIDERLYYKGVGGVYVYTGTLPVRISAPLGEAVYGMAEAERCGKKYYIAMVEGNGGQGQRRPGDAEILFPHFDGYAGGNEILQSGRPTAGTEGGQVARAATETEDGAWGTRPVLFVYDTTTGLWHTEDAGWTVSDDDQRVHLIGWRNGLYLNHGGLMRVNGATDANGVVWYAETGALGLDVPQRKFVTRFDLRFRLELGSYVSVWFQYDESGRWHRAAELRGTRLHTQVISVWPRRCDTFRMRIEGAGGLTLYSVCYLRERGSDGC